MTDKQDNREWWTPKEVAEHMKVSESTVRNLCDTSDSPPADRIKAAKLGRQFRIHGSEVNRLRLKGMRQASAPVVEVADGAASGIIRGGDIGTRRRLKL